MKNSKGNNIGDAIIELESLTSHFKSPPPNDELWPNLSLIELKENPFTMACNYCRRAPKRTLFGCYLVLAIDFI